MVLTNNKKRKEELLVNDLTNKVKRSKVSLNEVEVKCEDGGMVVEDHHCLSVVALSKFVGDRDAIHGYCISVDSEHTAFTDLPPASTISDCRPRSITPNESMMSLHDDKRDFLHDDSIQRTRVCPSLVFEQSQLAKTHHQTEMPCDNRNKQKLKTQFKATKPRRGIFSSAISIVAMCGSFLLAIILLWSGHDAGSNTVYVPGAGFSGFWFTLGRLRSIREPTTKQYYCFSAGCLGVVATLSNFTIDEVSDMAIGVQAKWRTGEISHYEVVRKFLDVLLQRFDNVEAGQTAVSSSLHLLSRLYIITSVKGKYFGLNHVIRTPVNIDELREMLLQTTWIPFALGDGLTYKGHLDGAFTAHHHPICEQSLDLPFIPDLYFNALNVNLSKQKLEKLWNAGLLYSRS